MSASVCTRKLFSFFRKQIGIANVPNRPGYIVLLPEVDPELADRLFANFQEDLPEFSNLSAEKINMIVGKQMLDHECIVRDIDRMLQQYPETCTDLFNDVLDPIEKSNNLFTKTFGILQTLYLTDSKLVPPRMFFGLNRKMTSAEAIKYSCFNIYTACKKCDKSKLTEEQARLVDRYLLEGELNAFEKPEREQSLTNFQLLQTTKEQYLFQMRVELARSSFYLKFNNQVVAREFPLTLLKALSDPGVDPKMGPWTVRLNYGIADKFLEYCPDREMRWTVWQGEQVAASNAEDERQLANSVCLETLRHYRHTRASVLGLDSYMDISLKTKMGKSLEDITNTLSFFLKAAKEAQMREILELQEYADSRGFEYPIQLWDVPYWSRKQKISYYNFENERWRPYFPFETVMAGLFALCSNLFGVRFEQLKNASVWHPDVKFYQVYEPENDKPVAGFYIDPYVRENKMLKDPENVEFVVIRQSSRIGKTVLPLTSLIMNYSRPENGIPSLLSFTEVRNLFCTFGFNLQHLLCKSSYSALAGLNFVEFDAVPLVGRFMVNWLYDPKTFDSIHGHYETGEKLKDIDLYGLKTHMAGYNMSIELYKANLDILMHTKYDKFWGNLVDEIWDEHFIFPLSNYHSDPCRYIDIFCNMNMGGAYYSRIWGEMLAADAYKAFLEQSADHSCIGARFKDTFLTFGGTVHASETFRRFRGRDPCPEILLENYGLTERKIESAEKPKVLENEQVVVV